MIIYTKHAEKRMEQRNFTTEMIEDSLCQFIKFGKWDQKGDRLTLKTNSDDFHSFIREQISECETLKSQLSKIKSTSPDEKVFISESIDKMKKKYKEAKKKLKNLRKLETKKNVTLVLNGNVLLTVFIPTRHFKKDCDFYSSESLANL
ncbi:DUF4258 domain-containing protein [Succinivibrio sp.]|uniref:DUF4258 domain-containing protein n=1 Tax=Succinivibrio sp. TaxID=2053619 RepID=UPI0025D83F19|nr:DUF4258 domain-containing protein [Succinivibrio sp.]MBQ9220634.1 DUF4258 domain-containing protein [Succinivibrio sp.]